jgi:hypothetical protein
MGKKNKGGKNLSGGDHESGSAQKEDLDRDSKLKEIVSIQSIEEPEEPTSKDFIPSSGISTFEANELLLKHGRNELEDKSTPKVCVHIS